MIGATQRTDEIDYCIRRAKKATRKEVELALTQENGCGTIIDLDSLASELDNKERDSMFKLSTEVSARSWKWVKENRREALGLKCALCYHRNYVMALMTANAVKYYKNTTGKSPKVLEMGAGSALLCLAAKLTDPDAAVVGIENSDIMLEFAKKNLFEHGLVRDVMIINEDFLDYHPDSCVDVVINENISGDLVNEPLFPAVNAIRQYTHGRTIFVPGGVNIYFEGQIGEKGKHKRVYVAKVDFSRGFPDKIILRHSLEKDADLPLHTLLDLSFDLLDFKGDTVLSKRNATDLDITTLELRGLPLYVDVRRIQSGQEYELKVVLDYNQGRRLPIGNLVPRKIR